MPFIPIWPTNIEENASLMDCLLWIADDQVPMTSDDTMSRIFSGEQTELKLANFVDDFEESHYQAAVQLLYLLRLGHITASGTYHPPVLNYPYDIINTEHKISQFSHVEGTIQDRTSTQIDKKYWQVKPAVENWRASTQRRRSDTGNPKILAFAQITVPTIGIFRYFPHKDFPDLLMRYENGQHFGKLLSQSDLPILSPRQIKQATRKKKGGRKNKYKWDSFFAELERYLGALKKLPRTKSVLVEHMQEWTSLNWEEEPGETRIKNRVNYFLENSEKYRSLL